MLPDPYVAKTQTTQNTSCCYSFTLPTFPTSLYTSTVSSALTVTAPVTGVTLQVLEANGGPWG